MIRFNKPYITGNEIKYIQDAIDRRELSGDGFYTKACTELLNQKLNSTCFLTTSGTDALEMAAILAGIQPGDEVIMPSYTFVSTANAFVMRGATVRFVDSRSDSPNLDEDQLEALINSDTKAIVVVHYGGVACDMDRIMNLAEKNRLFVIEDAAHAIDATYKGKPLGTIGHFGAFSFHATKNIIAGEGGMLVVNDEQSRKRAEIIREKGTNRTSFFRGEVDKYGWVDVGSSFLPSEIVAAFLLAQVEQIDEIQQKRIHIWNRYDQQLRKLEGHGFQLPQLPDYASNNAHLYYLVCPSLEIRSALIEFLSGQGIKAVFHYQSLHRSDFYARQSPEYAADHLPNSDKYTDCLLRLPLFPDLTKEELTYICDKILEFTEKL
ncbi:MAG: dTDP-4-amino-4,6-dideoxygalactose transaminase [Flavobacteriales bacterium]|nr:dTDP-4-amino-4,6-dideoxygalactose transaminase [Flavobacteriales bacterium]